MYVIFFVDADLFENKLFYEAFKLLLFGTWIFDFSEAEVEDEKKATFKIKDGNERNIETFFLMITNAYCLLQIHDTKTHYL